MEIKKQWIMSALAVLGMGAIIFLAVGSQEAEPEEATGPVRIAVTIPPMAEFVEKIGGAYVSVTTMVPEGADPHTYEMTPSQLQQLADAEMYVVVGSGIEFETAWLDDIVSLNRDIVLVNAASGVNIMLLESFEGEYHDDGEGLDPHIWTSPQNVIRIVDTIARALSQYDPAHASAYEGAAASYITELEALDEAIGEAIMEHDIETILVLHPAWGYFARDYGISQIAIEVEGKEPGPQTIEQIIETAKSEVISVVIASPEFSTKTAEVIADEIGGTVAHISPLEKAYIDNMYRLIDALEDVSLHE
jgi:zinc transport system substrate-binding protein